MADWRGEADRWWAGVLWAPETAIRAGGVFAASHLDHVGVLAVAGAAAPVVYGPADVIELLRGAAAHADREALLQGDHLAGALGARAGQVRGPAWYGYATAVTLAQAGSPAVRELSEADLPLLAQLHERAWRDWWSRRPPGRAASPARRAVPGPAPECRLDLGGPPDRVQALRRRARRQAGSLA